MAICNILYVFQVSSFYVFFKSNKGSTSYLFTLRLKYSIIHFNVPIIFTSTSKLSAWSFRPKVDSPEVASPALVKVDSTDNKQHSTTPIIKDGFCLDYFAAIT